MFTKYADEARLIVGSILFLGLIIMVVVSILKGNEINPDILKAVGSIAAIYFAADSASARKAINNTKDQNKE